MALASPETSGELVVSSDDLGQRLGYGAVRQDKPGQGARHNTAQRVKGQRWIDAPGRLIGPRGLGAEGFCEGSEVVSTRPRNEGGERLGVWGPGCAGASSPITSILSRSVR